MTGKPTWAGRIDVARDESAQTFLDTEWDEHLICEQDVVASLAHVHVLEDAGLLTRTEARRLIGALRRLDPLSQDPGAEDVHSAVEHAVTSVLGEAGSRLHAGRSRNDLVATDLRLYTRARVLSLADAVADLRETLIAAADASAEVVAPGYTHGQRAQPVTIGHWLLAHAFAFARDSARLIAAHESADISPLGAGALAGNTLGLRPDIAAAAMGFSRTFGNSIDAVSSRDFLLDACFAYATVATELSRLCEEIVLWSSSEFAYVALPDAFATGSSMMPQKRNPDVAELARAETGAAVACLVDLFVTLKAQPLAYNRDLQATKRVLGPLDRAPAAVRAVTGLVRGLRFRADRLADAVADDTLYATDLAEALVARRVPFRRAHETVAGLVGAAEESSSTLADAVRARPAAVKPLTLEEALAALEPAGAVARRTTPGGPSLNSVRAQLSRARRALAADRTRLERLRARLPDRDSAARTSLR